MRKQVRNRERPSSRYDAVSCVPEFGSIRRGRECVFCLWLIENGSVHRLNAYRRSGIQQPAQQHRGPAHLLVTMKDGYGSQA